MRISCFVVGFQLLLSICLVAQSDYPFQDTNLSTEERVADLLSQLTIEEKIGLLQSTSIGIPRLGIDKYYHGNEALHGVVKGGRFTVFPQAIGLAATWNPDLIHEVATVISDEARAKWNFYEQGDGQKDLYSDMLTFWSPTVNMARDPRWGRTPETYGEDPVLTSKIGVAFVTGLQGDDDKYLKVVATPKHFVANNQEENRFAYNAKISEKALREYYFPAYKACITEGNAQSVMSAYNALNDVPSTANPWLLNTVLRDEWGFSGYVVSDCGAVTYLQKSHQFVTDEPQAAKAAIEAGLDLECGNNIYTHHLLPAYEQGLVSREDIDQAAGRVLSGRFKLGIFDPVEHNPYAKISPAVIGSEKHQQLAIETSRQSIVLLKNEDNLLPLDRTQIKKIAVVGFNANNVVFGDYSGLPVIKPISPLQGILDKVGDEMEVIHVPWKTAARNLNLLEKEYLFNENGINGLSAEYFDNKLLEGTPRTRVDAVVNFDPVNQPPDPYTSAHKLSIRWTGFIKPNVSGTYKIGVNSDDGVRLWIEDKLIVDEWHNRGTTTDQVEVEMIAEKQYKIRLEYFDNGGDATCQLLWKVPGSSEDLYEQDRIAAKESDYVIAVMGINKTIEKEGRDRSSLDLPEDQLSYLQELYALNENMIVVLVAGSSLAINWIDENVPAIVDAWYPGEGGGVAIADVLFGDYNPAGRLPFTFYKSINDLPPMDDYEVANGRTYMYFEGDPLYAFGHGLSYTQFEYDELEIAEDKASLLISAKLNNSGMRDGDEVAQLYYTLKNATNERPIKKLIGFERSTLKKDESTMIQFEIPKSDLRYWDPDTKKWQFEDGEYEFMLGASSEDIRMKKSLSLTMPE